jgi:hypothetical protein
VSDLDTGKVSEWRVIGHQPWGVEVALASDPHVRATIALPYLRDLAPDERIEGPQDLPAVGDSLRAVVQVRSASGTLHLTARESDFTRAP